MRKREFLKQAVCGAVAAAIGGSPRVRASAGRGRLNLLFITVDDMNWSLPGFMGGRPGLTPNLDALAARSHRFVNNRTVAPICQPSREAMMTGLLPHHSGALGFTPVYEGTPTLTTILRGEGYFTAGIHKLEHMQPESCFPWDFRIGGKDRSPLAYERGVRQAIAHAKDARKPFFINCNINDPHRPFYGSPGGDEMDDDEKGPYKVPHEVGPEEVEVPPFLEDLPAVRKELAQYWNSTQRLDRSIGKILDVLRESGKADETVIFFSADHGMPFPFSKATCYDSGSRTPALISWPGMSKPTTFTDHTANVDYLPTLLEILEAPAPARLDGRSWLPIVRGSETRGDDLVVTYVNTLVTGVAYPMRAIQDMRHTLVFSPWADGKLQFQCESMGGLTFNAMIDEAKSRPQVADRIRQYVYGVPLAFYDLQSDPGQRVNLIGSPGHRASIDRMKQELLATMERTTDPQLENYRITLAGGEPYVEQAPALYRHLGARPGAGLDAEKVYFPPGRY